MVGVSGKPGSTPDDLHRVVYSELKPVTDGSQLATDSSERTQGMYMQSMQLLSFSMCTLVLVRSLCRLSSDLMNRAV